MTLPGPPFPPPPGHLLSADVVALTRALVAVPSVNPDLEAGGSGEEEAAHLCAGLLAAWGLEVEVSSWAPGRTSVVGRVGRGAPSLILNGHLDTVGVTGMSIPPFEPVLEGGRLWGRGSCDMKGGVAAILSVARALARSGGPERGTLTVVLTSDEEHASRGLKALLGEGLSGDAAIVCEPTSLEVMPANKGFAWWTLQCRGRAAHGSRPDEGRDAIRMAGRFLAGLDRIEAELESESPHPLLGRASIHAGTIRGGTAPSVYPARCDVVVEARTLPGKSPDDLDAALEALRVEVASTDPEVTVSLEAGLRRPPGELPGDHPLVAGLLDACRAEGIPAWVGGMSAWVESAWFLEAGIPSLCFGPGSIRQAHTADEFVPEGELRPCAAVLERFTRHWLSDGH